MSRGRDQADAALAYFFQHAQDYTIPPGERTPDEVVVFGNEHGDVSAFSATQAERLGIPIRDIRRVR